MTNTPPSGALPTFPQRVSSARRVFVKAVAAAASSAVAGLAWAAEPLPPPSAPAHPESNPGRELNLRLDMEGAVVELHFEPGFSPLLVTEAQAWVRRSAAAVARYFGRFPQARVDLVVLPVGGAGVRGGTTYADPAPWVRLRLGRETTADQLRRDWVLVHEMVHLAVPQVPRPQNWLHEGIATYVEGVARGRAGLAEPAAVWQEWRRGMPQGQPTAGDRGLDHTPTWGRTYWGGAAFCLLADVRIHQRSGLRLGLQQALQGVLKAGGQYGVAWPVQRILDTADTAVGQTTLAELYASMKDSPAPMALDALWRELGVSADGLDDRAPAAAVRRAILA